MATDPLLAAYLQHQDYALFESLADGAFRPIGLAPAFAHELFGPDMSAGESIALAGRLPFLDDFLGNAEVFWNEAPDGQLDSGTWIETGADGQDIPLDASAMRLADRRVLCIRHQRASYDEQVELLQRGREGLLAHERLLREVQKKEILLHCIVHDLSQPLTAMRGCFAMLASESTSPEVEELVQVGRRQAEKQETMIREILQAFSTEVSAQQGLDAGPGQEPSLLECAGKVARDYAAAFAERGARIEVDPGIESSCDWRVAGDESRLIRIFSNLVENALRYAPAGSAVTLRIEDEGETVRACVDDQGPGLPTGDSAPRLFALFSKGKERGGKVGLGLYFCRITVERWGGAIGCENRPEGGARFWFRLPRRTAARVTSSEGAVS